MIFSSMQFAAFFLVFFPLYWLVPKRFQNFVLLFASCFFYAAWDWRFLGLLMTSSAVAYCCMRAMAKHATHKIKRRFLILSLATDLGILIFFKYCGFFADNLHALLETLGLAWPLSDFQNSFFAHIILPVGISFYTFQSISFVIDVYRGESAPPVNFRSFLLYVVFFPQLVAGPIERAQHLYPQMLKRPALTLERLEEGAILILWGLFQKVFIADNLAIFVDKIFDAPPPYQGLSVLIAAYAFAFQIFGDFAGYSNIARGLAKLLGFDLMVNFNRPYSASNPREFWRRWHISLSTWLRDYLYKPLGGNRGSKLFTARNLMITMLLGGLWHGAAWTYILWGAYHGCLLIIHRATSQPINEERWIKALKTFIFFHLVCIGWLMFRSHSPHQFIELSQALLFHLNDAIDVKTREVLPWIFSLIAIALISEALQKQAKDSTAILKWPIWARTTAYVSLFYLISLWGVNNANNFIYFQF